MKTSEYFFVGGLACLFMGPASMEIGPKFGLGLACVGLISMGTAVVIQQVEHSGKKNRSQNRNKRY